MCQFDLYSCCFCMSNYHIILSCRFPAQKHQFKPYLISSHKSRKKVHFSNQRKTGSFFCRLSITRCQNQQKCVTLHFRHGGSAEYRGQPEKCNLPPFLKGDFLVLSLMPKTECALLFAGEILPLPWY